MTQNSSTPETNMPRTEKEKTTDARAAQEQSGATGRSTAEAASMLTPAADATAALDERILMALNAASDKKALDLALLDLRAVANFTDFFIIASGTNQRQVQAIADSVVERLREHGTRSARVEGYTAAEWVLVDYGDFIVHVFEEKARRFYDLERLWRDAARVQVSPQLLSGEVGGAVSERESGGVDGSLRTER